MIGRVLQLQPAAYEHSRDLLEVHQVHCEALERSRTVHLRFACHEDLPHKNLAHFPPKDFFLSVAYQSPVVANLSDSARSE